MLVKALADLPYMTMGLPVSEVVHCTTIWLHATASCQTRRERLESVAGSMRGAMQGAMQAAQGIAADSRDMKEPLFGRQAGRQAAAMCQTS